MLQRVSLFSLMLSALFVLSISSCSKPNNDKEARELIIGTLEDSGLSLTFKRDGTACSSL